MKKYSFLFSYFKKAKILSLFFDDYFISIDTFTTISC